MPRSADLAARQSVIGSSPCASASSCSFTDACARSSVSLAANTSERAAKNLSCASLNRFHSSASSSRPARPASFHWRISSR